jgi:hypothetical protein
VKFPPPKRLTTADRAFLKFHRENPKVYETLVRLSRKAKRQGRDRIGIKMLWEVARWEIFLRTTGDEYKLNNNYHSRYARLIMRKEPDLRGIFAVRQLKG